MPVLCNIISVVIRRDSIDKYYNGGWKAFLSEASNKTFCADDQLARIGFMTGADAKVFVETLEEKGLQFMQNEAANKKWPYNDILVIPEGKRPVIECDWIECGKIPIGERDIPVPVCWFFEGERFGLGLQINPDQMKLSVPHGWSPEELENISHSSKEEFESKYKFLRSE